MWQTVPVLDEDAANLEAFGPRLRAVRMRAGLTLEQLANRTGMSTSTLSRLERGQRRPTLGLLLTLSRHFRVPLDDLVGAPPVGDPRIRPRPVRRFGITWLPLSRNPSGPNAMKQILPPPTPDAVRPELRVHDGNEWLYVLSGSVRLSLADDDYLLQPGEAAEFETTVPHAISNAGDLPAEVLIIYGLHGDLVHLRTARRSSNSTRSE